MLHRILFACALLLTPLPAVAQQETLADIRQQLSVLFVDVQQLRRELSTTGGISGGTGGNTPLERLDAIEAELQRLVANTEQMEFRINSITADADNRLGDLNFRICELEPGCDISQISDTPLGGSTGGAAPVIQPQPAQDPNAPALAIGEQSDYDSARQAFANGDYQGAVTQLQNFTNNYPGSPLTAQVQFLRGEALQALGQTTDAARAYLGAFSGDPIGPVAPEALFKLGAALGRIGQTQDACLTLAEVNVRFPGNPAVASAQAEMQALGCQ